MLPDSFCSTRVIGEIVSCITTLLLISLSSAMTERQNKLFNFCDFFDPFVTNKKYQFLHAEPRRVY
jgi:hypothetical protein